MRGAYLILWRPPGDDGAAAALATEARLAADGAWLCAARAATLSLWLQADSSLPFVVTPPGLCLGRALAARSQPVVLGWSPGRPCAAAAEVADRVWGPYVAAWAEPDAAYVLRSSSGELDVLTWRSPDGLDVAASDLMTVPGWLRPAKQALNWDRIVDFVASPRAGMAVSLFDDVAAVTPGAWRAIGGEGAEDLVWRPSRFIAAGAPIGAAEALRAQVDSCTAAVTADRDALLMELSGGLDSAVVAGALAATGGQARVAAWINRVGHRRDGDERAYARLVTDRIGADLTCVEKSLKPLTAADFAELQTTTWPALNGVDAGRDRDMAERLAQCDADAIVSGQGGDAVFFQMATGWLAAGAVRRRGLLAVTTPTVAALARRMRQPVWRVMREARSALRGGPRPPSPASLILTPEAWAHGREARHPWERDVEDAPWVKQLQVSGLANSHLVRADCRRRRAGDILFPLLGQPLVELCLSIPAETLAVGIGDRPFARQALKARAPAEILARRAKGNLTADAAKLVAVSRQGLFDYLHDGCLAQAGVLDRAAIRRMLDPDELIWAPRPLEILNAAATEAWVRYWQGRVPDSPQAHR